LSSPVPKAGDNADLSTSPIEGPKPETARSATPEPASAEGVAALIARGDGFRFTGDIASARLFYERAAEQGSPSAARAMGETFDPLVLEQSHVQGVRGEAQRAAGWYLKAITAGDTEAAFLLQRLMTQ